MIDPMKRIVAGGDVVSRIRRIRRLDDDAGGIDPHRCHDLWLETVACRQHEKQSDGKSEFHGLHLSYVENVHAGIW
jgi:hypothetical protein